MKDHFSSVLALKKRPVFAILSQENVINNYAALVTQSLYQLTHNMSSSGEIIRDLYCHTALSQQCHSVTLADIYIYWHTLLILANR